MWKMNNEALLREFDIAMMGIYERALSEAKYKASRFLEMLYEHRGLETARILLHSPKVSEGYIALWERGRLDITVEAVIFDNTKWHQLFDNNEIEICRKRLKDYQYIK
jgi:hypothetical protein